MEGLLYCIKCNHGLVECLFRAGHGKTELGRGRRASGSGAWWQFSLLHSNPHVGLRCLTWVLKSALADKAVETQVAPLRGARDFLGETPVAAMAPAGGSRSHFWYRCSSLIASWVTQRVASKNIIPLFLPSRLYSSILVEFTSHCQHWWLSRSGTDPYPLEGLSWWFDPWTLNKPWWGKWRHCGSPVQDFGAAFLAP